MKKYAVGIYNFTYLVCAENRLEAMAKAAKEDGALDPIRSAKSGYWHARIAKETEESTLTII